MAFPFESNDPTQLFVSQSEGSGHVDSVGRHSQPFEALPALQVALPLALKLPKQSTLSQLFGFSQVGTGEAVAEGGPEVDVDGPVPDISDAG